MVEVVNDMANSIVPDTFKNFDTFKMNNGKFTPKDYAMSFVYGMEKNQRNRFKKMLEQNIKCGESVANSYGISYSDLMSEVKKILNVKEN